MKISYSQFQGYFSNLNWDVERCAENLTAIGHETDVVNDTLDIKITANRPDCKDYKYLAYDLSAVYSELELLEPFVPAYDKKQVIIYDLSKINNLLGSNFSQGDVHQLERFGFIVSNAQIQIPDHRSDISNNSDIAEEMLRLFGSKHIKLSALSKEKEKLSPSYQKILDIKVAMSQIGFSETVTNTFVRSAEVSLKNPFSEDLPYLQSDLLSGLLQTVSRNPYLKKTKFFEIANVFKLDSEQTVLGIIFSGYKNEAEIIEEVNSTLSTTLTAEAVDSLELQYFDIKQSRVFFAQIPIENISVKQQPLNIKLNKYTKLSKYPPLVRDVTVKNGFDVSAKIKEAIENILLIELVDEYTNPETQEVSKTYRIFIQKFDSSFTEQEIKQIDEQLGNIFN